MKIGIYAPYLNAYGGGEKYICKIAEILGEKNDVNFLVFNEPNISELEDRLNINLSKVSVSNLNSSTFLFSKLLYVRTFAKMYIISKNTKKYDLFINQEHLSIIPSLAKRSILICEVPPTKSNKLFWLYINPLTSLFFDNKLRTYDKIVTNSNFTKKWAERWYNREVGILYPPIEKFHTTPKSNIILSVGRFFSRWHNKKQLEMIRSFKQLYTENTSLQVWEYHLIGGETTKNQKYLKKCEKEAESYPIYFHINSPFKVLKELYGASKIFWHATGLGENENEHPELMEHFGITTGEAMSAGCVPIVINKGGQPEIVRNEIEGFLWNTTEDLQKHTLKLIKDEILLNKMSNASIKRSQEFDMNRFCENVKRIFEPYDLS